MMRDEEAVSPVIVAMLWVIIATVLAAVLFILINDLGSGPGCDDLADEERELAGEAAKEGRWDDVDTHIHASEWWDEHDCPSTDDHAEVA